MLLPMFVFCDACLHIYIDVSENSNKWLLNRLCLLRVTETLLSAATRHPPALPNMQDPAKSLSFAIGCSLASVRVVSDTKKSPLELEVNESSSACGDSSEGKDFKTNNKKLSQQKSLYSGVNFKAHTITWLHTEWLSCNGTYSDVCVRNRNI